MRQLWEKTDIPAFWKRAERMRVCGPGRTHVSAPARIFPTLLERSGGVAIEDGDCTGAIQVECAGVLHVIDRVSGDFTRVFNGRGAAVVVEEAVAEAATRKGRVIAGETAVADRHPA